MQSLLHSIQCLVSNADRIKKAESLPQDAQYHVDDMNNFEAYSKGTLKMEDDESLINEKHHLREMEEFSTDIASRAAILRDGVLGLLRIISAQGGSNISPSHASVSTLKEQIARLESELATAESKLEEMANARNEAMASERRVRRGLYRLVSSRLTLDEVLKAVEKEDNGVSFTETLDMIDGVNSNKTMTSSPVGTSTALVSSSDIAMSSPAFSASVNGGPKDSPAASHEEVARLKKSLQDATVISETREKRIEEVSSSP